MTGPLAVIGNTFKIVVDSETKVAIGSNGGNGGVDVVGAEGKTVSLLPTGIVTNVPADSAATKVWATDGSIADLNSFGDDKYVKLIGGGTITRGAGANPAPSIDIRDEVAAGGPEGSLSPTAFMVSMMAEDDIQYLAVGGSIAMDEGKYTPKLYVSSQNTDDDTTTRQEITIDHSSENEYAAPLTDDDLSAILV